MYLLYIDESENSDKASKVGLQIFGLSGLLITPRYVASIVDSLLSLKVDYKIPIDKEIRGYEIFSQNRWHKLSDNERRDFCFKLSELIVNKNSLKKGYFIYKNSEFQRKDYLSCLEKIIDKSAKLVASQGSNTAKQLMIIFDENDKLETHINKTILNKRKEIYESLKKKSGKTCRIIDHGFPGKSHFSEMLQLSDFTGYVLRLSKTLQRKDTLFKKAKDPRFVNFVDKLVEILNKKIQLIKL